MTAFDFSKAVISGRDKLCCTTAFFLLPSCGSSLALYRNAFWWHRISVFVLISVTNSMYRIREYPRIMRKQYSFFHFPSSYTR